MVTIVKRPRGSLIGVAEFRYDSLAIAIPEI
jgi:hypothetical protein